MYIEFLKKDLDLDNVEDLSPWIEEDETPIKVITANGEIAEFVLRMYYDTYKNCRKFVSYYKVGDKFYQIREWKDSGYASFYKDEICNDIDFEDLFEEEGDIIRFLVEEVDKEILEKLQNQARKLLTV